MLSKFVSDIADGKNFGTGDVQDKRRRLAMGKGAQTPGIRVALPDDIYGGHRQGDRTAFENGAANINEDAVAKFDGIVQAQDSDAGSPSCGAIFEHALAAQGGLRVLANRADWRGFGGAPFSDEAQWVHIAGPTWASAS